MNSVFELTHEGVKSPVPPIALISISPFEEYEQRTLVKVLEIEIVSASSISVSYTHLTLPTIE